VAGCGGPKEAEDPHVVESAGLPETEPQAPALESVDTPLTELERAKVAAAIDDGLGQFLQKVELEASMNEGRFEGFRIVRFAVPEDWRGVGLLVGDVVTSINDLPIERPEQAHAAFVALRSAPVLEVAYLRAGQPMRLSLPIVGPAPPPPAADPPAATPANEAKPSAAPSSKKKAP
jgi:type II secretory pathway component PulC